MLEGQTDRNHRERSQNRADQMMMPGRLTSFTGEASISGQHQAQTDYKHAQ